MRPLGLRSALHSQTHAAAGAALHAALAAQGPWPDRVSWFDPALTGSSLGNDVWGNCVEAGILRQLQCWRIHAAGDSWTPTPGQAIGLYGTISGFDVSIGMAPGPGTRLADAEEFWAATGLQDEERFRTATAVIIPPVDLDAIDRAIAAFGGVGACWDLPVFAESAPEWTASGGSPAIAGGHFTTMVAFDRAVSGDDPGRYSVLTWGGLIQVSAAFLAEYLSSAVAWVSPDWLGPDGKSPSGLGAESAAAAAAILNAR